MNTVYLILIKKIHTAAEYSKLAKKFLIKKICENYKLSPEDIVLLKTENGKPYIKDHPDIHFNISHTNGAIAVAFSDSPIGVDVEKIRDFNLKITERFFTPYEKKHLFCKTPDTKRSFFEIWTKKEAYIKRYGLTLSQLKSTDTKHIHTFQRGKFILSVCSESDKSILITLENESDM